MTAIKVATWSELEPSSPTYALVANVDLVVIRWPDQDEVSVLYGRCLHRGALLSDGEVRGKDLICGVHQWDYRYETGVSAYNPAEKLKRFRGWIDDDGVWVDEDEVVAWEREHPQAYDRDAYQGLYADPHGTPDEPFNFWVQELAEVGRQRRGHHGRVDAMGVPRHLLPEWEELQLLTAQLHRVPLLDAEPVATELVIGPEARKPLRLDIPLFVSDMSFGALSEEAKISLARGAELAGTGICSGEGGMLPEEQKSNSRYFYELASARFGFNMEKLRDVQAFHFKGGQGAKTGTGGHLPGSKVVGKIAEVRGLEPGQDAISPSRFPDWDTVEHFRRFAAEVRECTGGIPVGFKLSAQHIERDIEAALEVGVDYIILDGRGGGTGAAPLIFRNNISVPTIPALARARRCLDRAKAPQRDVDHHRRPSRSLRVCQGLGPWRRRGGARELGHPGDRLPGHARLQHEQLPGRHRDPEAGAARAHRHPDRREATRTLLPVFGRAHAGTGPGLRAPSPQRVRACGPDNLESRHGGSLRGFLRRGHPAVKTATCGRAAQ